MNGQVMQSFSSIGESFQSVWFDIFSVIPAIVFALIIVLVGLFLGWALKHGIAEIFSVLKIDNLLAKTGLNDLMKKAGYKLKSGIFVGEIVRWFVIIVFLIPAFDTVGLHGINEFITGSVLPFIPQLFIAVIVLFLGSILAEFFKGLVKGSVKASGHKNGELLGSIAKWVTMIFVIVGALLQLNIFASIIQPLVIAIFAMLAIAGGIAFGLGGRDAASDIIQKARDKVNE